MAKLIGFIVAALGGYLGWWIGSLAGLFPAVVLSGVGSGVGLYFGGKIVKDYLAG